MISHHIPAPRHQRLVKLLRGITLGATSIFNAYSEPSTEIWMNLNESGIEGIELIKPGYPAFGFSSLSGEP